MITFISAIYLIECHTLEKAVILPNHDKDANYSLPPAPKERWFYIKALENSKISTQSSFIMPSASVKMSLPAQLTNEQRQLLEQMQADMCRKK